MEQKNDRQKWLRMTARVGAILFGNAIYAEAVEYKPSAKGSSKFLSVVSKA